MAFEIELLDIKSVILDDSMSKYLRSFLDLSVHFLRGRDLLESIAFLDQAVFMLSTFGDVSHEVLSASYGGHVSAFASTRN